jgi:predicted amidohydrolase YtcJ
MKPSRTLLALLACAAALPASAQMGAAPPAPAEPAELIVEDARIYTPGGPKTAMAVAHGTIVAIGDAAAVAPHRVAGTKIIKLGGKTILPGLHDMHVHPQGAGLEQLRCKLLQGATAARIIEIATACVAKAKPGEWVTGAAYQADSFGGKPPHKSMLDKIAPGNPVVFRDISGHSSWANSAALKAAGITRDTPNPAGGIIEKDAAGEPTGILRENATALLARLPPPPTAEQIEASLRWSLSLMLSHGITAFDDAGVGRDTATAYAKLADDGFLKQRVRGCLWARDPDLIASRNIFARARFSPSCIKVVLDGVPTDAHTAAMVEPYEPLPGGAQHDEAREKGLLLIPQAELDQLVTKFDAEGLTVKFHAAGDGAVRAGLDAIAAARRANGFSGAMHNVGHNSFVQMDDIARARSISASFEFSPYIWFPSPITADIVRAVGAERMKRWIPVKDALDAGALTVPGSDWPVVPEVNPWVAIETLVTRQKPGGGGDVLGAQERITIQQAVDIFTRQSARQMNFDHATGSLEAGKVADFIVIDRDVFTVPVTTVHDTKVLMTFIAGEKVFELAAAK